MLYRNRYSNPHQTKGPFSHEEGVAKAAGASFLPKDRKAWNDETTLGHGLGETCRRACAGRDTGERAYRDVPAGVPTTGLPQAMLGKVPQFCIYEEGILRLGLYDTLHEWETGR